MTKDDIIRMAREASSIPINTRLSNTTHDLVHFTTDELERFAHLVTAAEREACAKVCAELHWPWRMGDNSGPNECAEAIRARSQS